MTVTLSPQGTVSAQQWLAAGHHGHGVQRAHVRTTCLYGDPELQEDTLGPFFTHPLSFSLLLKTAPLCSLLPSPLTCFFQTFILTHTFSQFRLLARVESSSLLSSSLSLPLSATATGLTCLQVQTISKRVKNNKFLSLDPRRECFIHGLF